MDSQRCLSSELLPRRPNHLDAINFLHNASDNTEYDLAGSCRVMRWPTFGFSSICGITRVGSPNVLPAFKSGPVIVMNAFTALGVASRQITSTSWPLSKCRLKKNSAAVLFSVSTVAAISTHGTSPNPGTGTPMLSIGRPSVATSYPGPSGSRTSARPRAYFSAQAYG